MKKILFLLLIIIPCDLIFEVDNCNAQFTQEWVSTYNLSDADEPYDITCRNDFIYVAGFTAEGYWGPLVLKYNKNGGIIWAYKNIYMGYGFLRKILTDSAGNVYVTGAFNGGSGLYMEDIITFKLDPNGNLKWLKRYSLDSLSRDLPNSMCLDNSGNVYVTGSSGSSRSDVITIKYDSLGNQIWAARYLSTHNGAGANDIKIDKKGFLYVAASCEGKATLLKYNTDGNLIWFREYNQGFGHSFNKLNIDDSSRIYLAGYSASFGLLMIYNDNGDLIKLSLDKPVNVTSLQLDYCKHDKWNNLYAVGRSDYISGNMNICLVKYNSQGILIWSKIYDGGFGLQDYPIGMDVDNYGNCYVVGRSLVALPSYNIMKTLAYDKYGNLNWDASYYGEDTLCTATAIAVDTSGGVYVTGASNNNISNTGSDIVLIKYNSLVGISPNNNNVPSKHSLSQNYPNPFNPITNVKFSIVKAEQVKLIVYDIQGREVQTLVNERLQPGTYEATFDGSSLNSGVYFYKLITDGFTETKKMLFIK